MILSSYRNLVYEDMKKIGHDDDEIDGDNVLFAIFNNAEII